MSVQLCVHTPSKHCVAARLNCDTVVLVLSIHVVQGLCIYDSACSSSPSEDRGELVHPMFLCAIEKQ